MGIIETPNLKHFPSKIHRKMLKRGANEKKRDTKQFFIYAMYVTCKVIVFYPDVMVE